MAAQESDKTAEDTTRAEAERVRQPNPQRRRYYYRAPRAMEEGLRVLYG